MTDDLANWRTELIRNIDRSITAVEKRLTAMRISLAYVDQGAYVTPSAEVIANEVLQLTLLASKLDQLIDIEKETQA